MDFNTEWEKRRLTTPRTAAIAGILFGLLFSASLVLMRTAIPEEINRDPGWVTAGSSRINLALGLMPFAGIAYLWFIGVVRDRLGEYEDKFFSTVFFGSSLIFIGLVFIAMAIAGGILTTYQLISKEAPDYTVIYFRPGADAAYQQRVRPAHGGRHHDLAGDDLDAHRVDAPLAGRGDLLAGPGACWWWSTSARGSPWRIRPG